MLHLAHIVPYVFRMCGVAGIFRIDGALTDADASDLRAMTAAIAHRGPDDSGHWMSNGVGLGHRRLAILDRSEHAAQPMLTDDRSGALAYNGEVYNFRELRAELEREGVCFRSSGDTEVVLKALHTWGPEAAVPRFNGMFALAYYDANQRTLWLARDRLGIKPLSLAEDGGRLLFASEDKAIAAALSSAVELDPRALTLRFMGMRNSNQWSLLRGVERVPPGTMIKLAGRSRQEITYWHPLEALDATRLMADRQPDAEKAVDLTQLIEDSVAMHLVADTPVATCLSGGVDSGILTALAARRLDHVQSYVADPDQEPNEAAAAAATARVVGADLNRVPLDRDRALRNWPGTVLALEATTLFASDPALLAITRRCRNDAIPVMLTGEGADELFGGYPKYKWARQRWRPADRPWLWMRGRRSRARLFQRLERSPLATSIVAAGSGERMDSLSAVAPLPTMMQMRCAQAVSDLPKASDRGLVAARLYDLTSHLQELLNRHDRLGMASSLEMRVPFIENRIIDFALHLPARQLYRFKRSKALLKTVATPLIPSANIHKRKLGFPLASSYYEGTEALLKEGMLKDVLRWTAAETDAAIAHAQDDHVARLHMVSAEMLAQMVSDGRTPDQLGERLRSLTADHAGA